MKKRLICIISVLALLISCSALPVNAAEEIKVFVDSVQVQFDVSPKMVGGRTMVPLRAIFEALGASVDWDQDTQTITAYNEAYIVKCTIGKNEMYVNNVEKTVDVAPMIIDGRTLVPARFVAEAFNCKVDWDAAALSVNITSAPIDYSSLEKDTPPSAGDSKQNTSTTPTVSDIPSTAGTRNNPYSPFDGATIEYNKYSFEPVRKVQITCTNTISGATANALAQSENRYNDVPNSNQEWRFFEFNVKYISSTDGADDILKGSDIIYKDTFFKLDGSSVSVADMATLGKQYRGHGVFDVELYPGSSGKVVIGILVDKNSGDLLLRVPRSAKKENTWILCNP